MGAASTFGRVGGIQAPTAIGLAYGPIGFGGVLVITTVVLAAGSVLAVMVFGLSTASRTLEDIQAEELGAQGRTRAQSPGPIDGAGYAG